MRSEPESNGDGFKKGRLQTLKNYVRRFDAYQIDPRKSTATGGALTWTILLLSILFAVILFIQLQSDPLRVSNEIIWSSSTGPYPISLKCVSSSGCLISNTNEDSTPTSCVRLNFGEIIDLQFGYFNNPFQGISALALDTGEVTGVVAVRSDTFMPGTVGADSEGCLEMWHDVFPGTTLLSMVYTHNKTMSTKNARRREYFGLTSDSDSTILPGSTSCVSDWATAQSRLRLQQSANIVTVSKTFSFPSWLGTSSGTFAALLTIGGYLLSTIELDRVKKLKKTLLRRAKSTKNSNHATNLDENLSLGSEENKAEGRMEDGSRL